MTRAPASLRNRLIRDLGLTLLLLLACGGWWLDHGRSAELLRLFDRGLFEKARTFASLVEWEDGWIEVNYREDASPEFLPGAQAQYFQIFDGDIELRRSASLASGDLRQPGAGLEAGLFDRPLPDGRRGRCLAIVFQPRQESDPAELSAETPVEPDSEDLHWQGRPRPLVLLLARERESLDRQLASGRRSLSLALGLAWLASMLLLAVLVDRGLRPLLRLARTVRELDSSSLDRRLCVEGPWARELSPIVQQLDLLLERIQAAFRREREFTTHAAHELRTPVAELRSLTDVSLRLTGQPDRLRPLLEDLDGLSARMEGLISGLLALARSERPAAEDRRKPIALPDWFGARLRAHADWLDRQPVRLPSPALKLFVDEDSLGPVVDNLLANAALHGDPGRAVEVEWWIDEAGLAAIRLSNGASALRPSDLPRLAERFW